MNEKASAQYSRIAEAITYINTYFKSQPNLDEVAQHLHLSPFHFQRLFVEWAGISPKKFLQFISLAHAKQVLKTAEHPTLFNAAFETGLSGTSRLHDLFINIEGMTPAEYKNGGDNLFIQYCFSATPFGKVIVAATPKGICHLAFEEEETAAFEKLTHRFPKAHYSQQETTLHKEALRIFKNENDLPTIKLHLKGSAFQLKVWEALLKIPQGGLSTYGKLAATIGNPAASRAVGTAIGSNPIAYLIPCHRVIQASGVIGGYMWGNQRKTAMIAWEAAQTQR
jgi:AraC family transcriptional regulator of adaptative response/methylated-DNA-[protein]-cysteine methyltransferase